jgi:hypothetical protein
VAMLIPCIDSAVTTTSSVAHLLDGLKPWCCRRVLPHGADRQRLGVRRWCLAELWPMTKAARLVCSSSMTWLCGMVDRRVWMLSLGRRDRLSAGLQREDDFEGVRGDLGGTGKTMDWMKLERLVAFAVLEVDTGDPERQDMQGASGKERRGQR